VDIKELHSEQVNPYGVNISSTNTC